MSVKLLPPGGGFGATLEFSVGQYTALTYATRSASILVNPHDPAALAPSAPTPPRLPAWLFGLSEAGVSILGQANASGSTLVITVDYLEAQTRLTVKEVRRALPALLEVSRASGVKTLQIVASFANEELARLVQRLVEDAGGLFVQGGPCDTITFYL